MILFNFFVNIGHRVLSLMYFLGGLAKLAGQSMYHAVTPPFNKDRIFEQAKKAGYDSLPIVSMVALFIGFIFALQIANFMQRIGSEIYIASLVALALAWCAE